MEQSKRFLPVRADVEGTRFLDRAIAGYRIIDEVGSSSIMDDGDTRRRSDSVSTKGYQDGDRLCSTDYRIDAIERDMSFLVRSMQELKMSREPTSPEQRRRRHTERLPSRHNRDAFVTECLARERMEMPQFDGKPIATDIFGLDPIPKPYMFVQKLDTATLKKKLEYRPNITSSEYINAFAAMLADDRARDPAVLVDQLRHLHDVTTDSMNRPWHNVRQWSQFIFDQVEKGNMRWSDYQVIQNQRCRLSFMGPASLDPSDSRQQSPHSRETICLDYNNRNCQHGGKFKHHVENGIKFNHSCLYCFAATGAKRDHTLNDPCNQKQRDRAAIGSGSGYTSLNHQYQAYQHPNASGVNTSRYRQYTQTQYNPQPASQQNFSFPPPQLPKNQ